MKEIIIMQKSKDFFNKLRESEEAATPILDKIIKSLSDSGFNSSIIDKWIEEEISKIEESYKFNFMSTKNGNDKEHKS